MRPNPETLKLPAKLIEELGGQDAISAVRKTSKHSSLVSRKDRRKTERANRNIYRTGPPPLKKIKTRHLKRQDVVSSDAEVQPLPQRTHAPKNSHITSTPQPKSILKIAKRKEAPAASGGEQLPSPPPPGVSRATLNKLAEDESQIAALEKKLGIKGKKSLPKAFKDDGIDDLLYMLDWDNYDGRGKKKELREEDDNWLLKKRKIATAQQDINEEESSEEETMDDNYQQGEHGSFDCSSEEESDDNSANDNHLPGTDEDFQGFESDAKTQASVEKRVRENPYVAPVVLGSSVSTKYIPPSLRKPTLDDSEQQIRLRRQAQGLVNRLTEANLLSILNDTEKLFHQNARQYVTSTLVDLILTPVCEPTSLPDTLILLSAGFIAAIYKVIGTDFGAHVIQRVVELFDIHYTRQKSRVIDQCAISLSNNTKEASNLIALLAELYNFQVVGSCVVFDYIRLFLEVFSEFNAELLLKIIRTSGHQLRQEDPSSLKDIVNMIQSTVMGIGESKFSVRTKFIIETINDLKNNRMKIGASVSSVASEHAVRMKKTLGTLNSRAIKGREPLRIGLKDIQESDKRGKWWLVGASWTSTGKKTDDDDFWSTLPGRDAACGLENRNAAYEGSDLAQLARDQRMNTDIRRAIFVTIISASDYQDAYSRLMKLKLKKAQELEIPKVLIHCTNAEKSYNPYYTLIAKKLCADRKLKMAFQFSLWDLFKKMGERDNGEEDNFEGEDGESALDTRAIVNLAKLFGSLIVDGGLTLMVLKNLNWRYLQPQTRIFMEVFFITIFLQSQRGSDTRMKGKSVTNVFSRVKDSPSLFTGMRYFLRRVVIKTDIAGGKAEKAMVKWCCKTALDFLEATEVAGIVD